MSASEIEDFLNEFRKMQKGGRFSGKSKQFKYGNDQQASKTP